MLKSLFLLISSLVLASLLAESFDIRIGSLGGFKLLVLSSFLLFGVWQEAVENFGKKKDGIYRLALLFGLFAAVSTIGDWYLNAPLAYRPLDEGELFRLKFFLERPKRVLLPPDLSWNGMVVLAFAALSFFFNGFILVHSLAADLPLIKSAVRKSPFHLPCALCAVFLACKAGLLFQVNAYEYPQVMKIYMIFMVALIVFKITYLVLLSPYYLYIVLKMKAPFSRRNNGHR